MDIATQCANAGMKLGEMTVVTLREIAKKQQINGWSKMKKAELMKALYINKENTEETKEELPDFAELTRPQLMKYLNKHISKRYMDDKVFFVPEMVAAAKANRQMLYRGAKKMWDIQKKDIQGENANEVYAKIVKIMGERSYKNADSSDDDM